MVKLKDIVKGSQDDNSTDKSSVVSIANSIATKMSSTPAGIIGISENKQAEFAEQAASLVTNDKFLDELQEQIGEPSASESEDEFVAKAKIKMRELLKSKLK